MRECQQCGEGNPASSRFCVVCGTPLAPTGSPAPGGAHAGSSGLMPVAPPAAGPSVGIAGAVVVSGGPAVPARPVAPMDAAPGGTGRPEHAPAAGGQRDLGADFPLDGPRTLVGFLVSYESVELGQYWPILQGRNVIGRRDAATGLDIEVSHPTTSSLHAVLLAAARPGRVLVEDTNSTNGTFVNDNMIVPGQRWELRDGDHLRFGLFNAIVKIVQQP